MICKSLEFLCKKAVKLGAKDSKIIKASTVVTGAWVRNKCQYGCPGFGEGLTCPPHTPSPGQTRAVLDSYKKAILLHCKSGSLHDISDIVFKIEKAAFLAGFYKAFGMGAGPCRLCVKCNVKVRCRRPYQARPSMEACGIDVYQTARRNGFTIEVVESFRCKANYFGLVLIE
jgi:predicted metal-binding protein